MKTKLFLKRTAFLLAPALLLTACGQKQEEHTLKMIEPVNFSNVEIQDAFWSPRLQTHKDSTLAVCIDQIENQTGRIRNFENAAKGEGEHSGIFFDDSDVYKALEGMAYSLQNNPDPVLEAKCDEWIDKFAAAQQADGYINTFYTLRKDQQRWTDMDRHEMYCAGHLCEAAVAYYNVTGKRKLLDVATRMVDYMMTVFGPEKRHWVPGHEEIELALVKVFKATGERKYLDFAHWLLEERGHGYGVYTDNTERQERYYQDAVPVCQLSDISGHAVRSMYLYCGMADVAAYIHDTSYISALFRVWDDVVLRNMYITGGIGQSASNEGFTADYDLPNKSAYCETCASVGMVLWNWRMNQFTGDAKYIDILERSLYNGALSGISLSGTRFFYVNPLESDGNHHRQAWYGCACCPSQLCRFLPSIGNYIYGTSNDALWVNLFIGGKASFDFGKSHIVLHQETNYPWGEDIILTIDQAANQKHDLMLRIPGWCKEYTIAINGKEITPSIDKGYARLSAPNKKWNSGDRITLHLSMPVEVVAADPRVKEDEGKRAIQRGPIVFCLEECDNPSIAQAALSPNTQFTYQFDPSLLSGIGTIEASENECALRFIPYYAWDNRTAGKMKVWIPFNE